MNHLLPDAPIIVVIAHFVALALLFGQTFIRYIRRHALKRQLQETVRPAESFRTQGYEQRQFNP